MTRLVSAAVSAVERDYSPGNRAMLSRLIGRFRPVGGFVICAGVYAAARGLGLLPETSTPSLPALARSWIGGLRDLTLVNASLDTLHATALGMLFSMAIGVTLGLATGLLVPIDRLTGVTIEFLRPVPAVALIPVAIVLFGIDIAMQIFLIATACVWPIVIATKQAVRSVDPMWRDASRVMGRSRTGTLLRVVLPASVPGIMTGLRISTSIALVVAVAAGLLTGSPGLGASLAAAQQLADVPAAFAILVMAGALGMALDWGLRGLERIVSGWQIAITEDKR